MLNEPKFKIGDIVLFEECRLIIFQVLSPQYDSVKSILEWEYKLGFNKKESIQSENKRYFKESELKKCN